MTHWWRAYNNAVDHAKLCLLSDRAHRGWFNLMCLASENGGHLPSIEVIALKLRMPASRADQIIGELVSRRLFDKADDGTLSPHNWEKRQYKGDVTDPTNAVRQRRYRNAKRNGDRNGENTVTQPLRQNDQRQSTESETERKKENIDAPDGAPSKYFFESGLIRLNKKDFDKWQEAFSHLDLKAELIGLTQWAETQGKDWFFAVSGALTKRNREIGIKVEAAKKGAPQFEWPSGIEGVQ